MRKRPQPQKVFSAGTLGLQLQGAFVFLFTAFLKSGNEWWPAGTAIEKTLQIDQFATPIGKWLLLFPAMLVVLTKVIWLFEWIGPILLFIPNKIVRLTSLGLFTIMLAGFGLTLQIGHFPFTAMTGLISFIPSQVWEKAKCKVATTKNARQNTLLNLVAGFFIIYILLWNISTLGFNVIPHQAQNIGEALRIDQRWNMFAPRPMRYDGWYVIEGQQVGGTDMNLMNGKPVTWEKPASVLAEYKDEEWHEYMIHLWFVRDQAYPKYFASYLCDDWNRRNHGANQIKNVTVNFIEEDILEAQTKAPPEKVVVATQQCTITDS